jgi:peroxiredoxin
MAELRPLVGEPAPDTSNIGLLDLFGTEVDLASFWAEGPAVLAFLRYFGCPFCQVHVRRLVEARERFARSGAQVVLIGQGSVGQANGFSGPRRLPYPVLVDPERRAYAAFGLVEGGAWTIVQPAVATRWVAAHATPGVRQGRPSGSSVRQLPGTFVVGPDGIVRLAHRARHAADDPAVDVVVAAVEAA